ncbi:active regulator of SIRT1 isoform X2 [Sarcophilus harrisii]|uniref:active regulator of SIRT1 isoform X2 n=1 Tax=Sarcophilus harrisii TaxID=9305 RepID=UPI001301E2AC|nr:active regulator of SIRT1 isoform X2 [Sarcophilus harrisii]
MSASLLRKGLELLGEPAGSGPAPARGRHSRIPEKKRPSRRNQATAKGRVPKSALEEFQKRQRRDHLQENLRFMKKKLVAVDPKITTKGRRPSWSREQGLKDFLAGIRISRGSP